MPSKQGQVERHVLPQSVLRGMAQPAPELEKHASLAFCRAMNRLPQR